MRKLTMISAALALTLGLASCGGGGGGGGGGANNDEAITSANAVDVAYRAVGTVQLTDTAQYILPDTPPARRPASFIPKLVGPGAVVVNEVLPMLDQAARAGAVGPLAATEINLVVNDAACGDGTGSVTITGTLDSVVGQKTAELSLVFDSFESCAGVELEGSADIQRIESLNQSLEVISQYTILSLNALTMESSDLQAVYSITGSLVSDVDYVTSEATLTANYTWTLNDLTVAVDDFTLYLDEADLTQVHYVADGTITVNGKEIVVSTPTDVVVDTTSETAQPESGVILINASGKLYITFAHSDDYYITLQLDKNEDGDFADTVLGDFTYGPATWTQFMTDAGVLDL